jgi:hypothetical protein
MTTEREREQEERRQYLANEKLLREKTADDRRASTYLAQALAASEDIGRRFKQVSPMSITGATPVPQYPTQPANSPAAIPWPDAPDPLGYSVEDMPVIGEPHEQIEAQRILVQRSFAPPASGGAEVVPVSSTFAVEQLSASPTNSPDVAFSVSATERAVSTAADAARSSLSQSSDVAAFSVSATRAGSKGLAPDDPVRTLSQSPPAALQTTLATRGPISTVVQRDIGARPFQRRL